MPVDAEKNAEGSLVDVVDLFDPRFVRLALDKVHRPLSVEIEAGYRILYLMVVEDQLFGPSWCFIKYFSVWHGDICVKFTVRRGVRRGLRGNAAERTPRQDNEAKDAHRQLSHRRQPSLPHSKGRREE